MRDHDSLAPRPARRTARPLLGLTILVVEDSRFASEALRLMCLRSGARIRRADSLGAAWRHLQVYRPSAIIIDAGLPDGSGLDLVAALARAQPRIGTILAMSGTVGMDEAARAAGADGFLAKPLDRLDLFQAEMLRHLPPDQGVPGLRPLPADDVAPDPLAYRDDLDHMRDLLGTDPDDAVLSYAAQFLSGVARDAGDGALAHAARGLGGPGAAACLDHVMRLIDRRLARRAAL
ncbi:response regulator [Roseovarius ramblicola]|uniref:Response regulator n=1 Tax=Roseovarius ramblicola TaxID=2022336 RepID=A0ABV5I401_9RHOB